MKAPHIIILIAALCLLSFNDKKPTSFSEEVEAKNRSSQWLLSQGKVFLESLPQESGKTANPSKTKENQVTIQRSFLVTKARSILSHVVADVEYTATITAEQGKYQYCFSNFKVFPYQRNRYGKYTRKTGRGQSLNKVSRELKPWVQKSIQTHVNRYILELRNSME